MKQISRTPTHTEGRSYDCMLKDHDGVKVKLTYEAYNAAEKCTAEIFDGTKWNPIFNLWDTGEIPEMSAYNIWQPLKRKARADDLFKKLTAMCLSILD